MVVQTIVVLVICGSVVVLLVLVWRTSLYRYSRADTGDNNDAQATATFRDMIKRMKQEIIIHDDGELKSFYNAPEIVELIESRLEDGCRVRCLFNKWEPSLKILRLQHKFSRERFEVQYTPDWFPREPDLHYKIVDNGALVYLSVHRDGGSREFEYFDCSEYPRPLRVGMFRRQKVEFRKLMEVAALEKVGEEVTDAAQRQMASSR